MKTLVLLRHGESAWNLENRFTGWTDVDLTPKGVQEAHEAGRLLREGGYTFDPCFTSVLNRETASRRHAPRPAPPRRGTRGRGGGGRAGESGGGAGGRSTGPPPPPLRP